jgi:hypothetical protein
MSPSGTARIFRRTRGAAAFQIKHLERLGIDRRLLQFKLSCMSVFLRCLLIARTGKLASYG